METYSRNTDKKQLSPITHIEVESADKHDANALLPVLRNTDKRDMSPKELLVDSLYSIDDNVTKAKDYQTDVLAPLMGAKSKGFNLEQFTLDSNNKITLCPQVNKPGSVKKPKDRSDCSSCPQLANYPVTKYKKAYTCYYYQKIISISNVGKMKILLPSESYTVTELELRPQCHASLRSNTYA